MRYWGSGTLVIEDSIIDRNESDYLFLGGGVTVTPMFGPVTFTMNRTEVSDNRTPTFGGGVAFRVPSVKSKSLHPVTARFGDDVRINRNYAAEGGGGIFAQAQTTLEISGNGFQMQGNGTLGDGGAMLVETGAHTITIAPGSRVAGSVGTFVGNEAWNGGAIALRQSDEYPAGGDTVLQLGSSNLADPQLFVANRAHNLGGGLFIDRPRVQGPLDGATRVCAFNAGFEQNDAAQGGSAVLAAGSSAFFRNDAQGMGCTLPPTPCTHISCNHYTGHKARLDNGQPSAIGNLFEVVGSATIQLFGARISYNEVPALFFTRGTNTPLIPSRLGVDTALIYANTVGTIAMTQCTPLRTCRFEMAASTIVANTLSQRVFENAADHFDLKESIIDQAGRDLVAASLSTTSTLAHLLYTSNFVSGIPSVRQGSPGFMNVATMDYRLSGSSQAIDNLPAREGVDFIGRDRNVDIPWRPNRLGPRDLGAVEAQLWEVDEVIFRSGFD